MRAIQRRPRLGYRQQEQSGLRHQCVACSVLNDQAKTPKRPGIYSTATTRKHQIVFDVKSIVANTGLRCRNKSSKSPKTYRLARHEASINGSRGGGDSATQAVYHWSTHNRAGVQEAVIELRLNQKYRKTKISTTCKARGAAFTGGRTRVTYGTREMGCLVWQSAVWPCVTHATPRVHLWWVCFRLPASSNTDTVNQCMAR